MTLRKDALTAGRKCNFLQIPGEYIYSLMPKSAGILCYRTKGESIEFLLVHPGGPYFKNKDNGYWTIPKGLGQQDEDLIDTAKREFTEETGLIADAELLELTPIRQKGGKWVHAWAMNGHMLDLQKFKSNLFELEWPPKSGNLLMFPEVDKIAWFAREEASQKINAAQASFINEVLAKIKR